MSHLMDTESTDHVGRNEGALAGEALHLWVDADPSGLVWTGLDCDDDLALLAAISAAVSGEHEHADLILEGISVCGGNAPLRHTMANMDLLLKHLGSGSEINGKTLKEHKYHAGYGWRSMQVGWKSLRYLNYIWPEKADSTAASDAIIEAAQRLPPNTLVVLMLGPTTNLARALQREEGLASRLKHVYLMGGEVTGQRLDLNTISDRASTRWIIENSNVPVTMIPIQTCGQVAVTLETIDRFEQQCCPQAAACSILPKMKLQISVMPQFVNPAVFNRLEPWRVREELSHLQGSRTYRWKPSSGLTAGFVPWDVIALLAVTHPELLFENWKWHRASVPPCQDSGSSGSGGEPCDGVMAVDLENAMSEKTTAAGDGYRGWIRVPHTIKSETQILDVAFQLLCDLPSSATSSFAAPPLLWGFIYPVLGVGMFFLVLTAASIRWCWGKFYTVRQTKAKKKA